jgi:hypothetical protein
MATGAAGNPDIPEVNPVPVVTVANLTTVMEAAMADAITQMNKNTQTIVSSSIGSQNASQLKTPDRQRTTSILKFAHKLATSPEGAEGVAKFEAIVAGVQLGAERENWTDKTEGAELRKRTREAFPALGAEVGSILETPRVGRSRSRSPRRGHSRSRSRSRSRSPVRTVYHGTRRCTTGFCKDGVDDRCFLFQDYKRGGQKKAPRYSSSSSSKSRSSNASRSSRRYRGRG